MCNVFLKNKNSIILKTRATRATYQGMDVAYGHHFGALFLHAVLGDPGVKFLK